MCEVIPNLHSPTNTCLHSMILLKEVSEYINIYNQVTEINEKEKQNKFN